jgi:hypothetical protein
MSGKKSRTFKLLAFDGRIFPFLYFCFLLGDTWVLVDLIIVRVRHALRKFTEIYGNPRARAMH